MAVNYGLGYLSAFDDDVNTATYTLVNGTTRKALSYLTPGRVARPRVYTLPSGAKVNYDSGGTAPSVIGNISQDVIDSGGSAFFDSMAIILGVDCTVTFEPVTVTANTMEISAVLTAIEDITPIDGTRDKVWFRITFTPYGDWTTV